jgi:hypothetical protein
VGWSNDQATTLNGQAFTYLNSTTTYDSGSALAIDTDATFTINGYSPSLGIVSRAFSGSDLPALGTTALTPNTAATVMQIDVASVVLNRIYEVRTNVGFGVRKNNSGETGVQITYTEDGSAPTNTSTLLCRAYATSQGSGINASCPIGDSYTRRTATGPLRVLLSIWNQGGGGATVANGNGDLKIELFVIDMGLDPSP